MQLSSSLPPGIELRRDRPLPTDENFKTETFYCIYVDNMDGAEFGRHESSNEDGLEVYFLVVKNFGASMGVAYHDGEKSMSYGTLGKTLGGQNDTKLKTTRPILKKVWTVLGETLWELSQPELLLKDVEVLAGS